MREHERTRLIIEAVHLRRSGKYLDEIAEQLGVSRPTAHMWLGSQRWEQVRAEHTKVCQFCRDAPQVPLARGRTDPRMPLVLALGAIGLSRRKISAQTGVARSSVILWLARHRREVDPM